MNAWILLGIAILLEVSATSTMKFAAVSGSKVLIVLYLGLFCMSFLCVFGALKHIDLSVAYAIWSGLGLVLTTCVGFAIFREDISFFKVLFLGCILVGVVGLKLVSRA